MNHRNRFIAEVPLLRQTKGVRWLVLEEDPEHTGGWYLYGYQDLDQGSEFDAWHLTRFEAKREAASRWGITEVDWKSYDGAPGRFGPGT